MRPISAVVLGLGTLTAASLLAGCRNDPGLWAMNYKEMGNYPPLANEPSDVRFERVMSVDQLKHHPQHDGLIIIGMTRFTTAPVLEPDEAGAPDHKLREFAASAGADVVRWAGRTIEFGKGNFEDRQEYYAVFYTHEWAQSVGLTFKNPELGSWVPGSESLSAGEFAEQTQDESMSEPADEVSEATSVATEPVGIDD